MISKAMLGLLVLSFLFPVSLSAEEKPISVKTAIIVASNEGSDFNLVNDGYRDQLIELFSYSAYNQVDEFKVEITRAKRSKVDLPEGYELWLTLQGTEKDRILVQAVVRKDKQQHLDTVLSILRPGVVFLGGPPVKEGVLIIVLETGF